MWPADFLAKACTARLLGPEQSFLSVSHDTRSIKPGAMYVALRGENFDGHQFIAQAVAAGATGVVVSQSVSLPDTVTTLLVPDTLLALQRMAHAARRQFNGPVIAVTGSNGKTSTRQLIASILRSHYGAPAVLATEGNFNNHIGVPLTLMRLSKSHRIAVIEMGMNHFNELSLLASLVKPDIAVITNAGPAHLEGVGSLAGVAQAKAEIFDAMDDSGVAILNADDYFLPYWEVVNRKRRCIRFGFGNLADMRGEMNERTSMLKVSKGLSVELSAELPFAGVHNGRNALAAVAVAHSLGLPAADIKAGLEAATNIGGRLTRRSLSRTVQVIDDSYNANPASVMAGLQVLLNEPDQKILVLGDMAELGVASDELHMTLLADIERTSVEHIFTLGPRTYRSVAALEGRTHAFLDIDALMAQLVIFLDRPTTVLVKGAHSMAMNRVIDRLSATFGENQ